MKKIIVIRGPLGAGKTTVSKILSQNLCIEYLSLDKIIDDNNLNGIPLGSFLKTNEIIFDTVSKSENSFIIDGCFYYQEQIDDLKEKFNNDVVIFTLTANIEKCIERDSKRPEIYGEDSARYVYVATSKIKAGYEIDNSNLTVEETVERIMEKILK